MGMDGKDLKSNQNHTENEEPDKELRNHLEEEIQQMTGDVEIPDSLRPENMEKLLEGKNTGKRPRRRVTYTLAAAACCLLVIGIAVLGREMGGHDQSHSFSSKSAETQKHKKIQDSNASSSKVGIATANDYDQIYKYIQAYKKSTNHVNARGFSEGSTSSAKSQGQDSAKNGTAQSARDDHLGGNPVYSDTNIRQEGIEEGDIVKTDGKYLYILNGQRVQIVSIQNKEMEVESAIRFGDSQHISEIYIRDGKLIVLYTTTEYKDGTKDYGSQYKQVTTAETFDVTNPEKPQSVGKIEQSGDYYTVRVSGDYVYLLSNYSVQMGVARTDVNGYIPEVQGKALDSSSIYLPQYAGGNQYTVISTFSLKQPDKRIDSKAVFGSPGLIYVSENNIYMCESYFNSKESDVTQTCIRKVEYKSGKLRGAGQTRIDGTLNDSFSIDEYQGNLRLVTTLRHNIENSGPFPIVLFGNGPASDNENKKDSNSLYILDDKLNILSTIKGLAEDESVYSARFMGDTGYFVTFKQIDPLFSVDLANPKKPKIMGELKIPGFSDYLHPYGGKMLLGIGMDSDKTNTTTEGVKLSMYDISNPFDVRESDKFVQKDCYSTNISYNYKAALISSDKNLIGFAGYGQEQHYYVFSYDKATGFKCLLDRELAGFSEARGVYSGDTLYIVAGNTVESYGLETFEKIDDIVL